MARIPEFFLRQIFAILVLLLNFLTRKKTNSESQIKIKVKFCRDKGSNKSQKGQKKYPSHFLTQFSIKSFWQKLINTGHSEVPDCLLSTKKTTLYLPLFRMKKRSTGFRTKVWHSNYCGTSKWRYHLQPLGSESSRTRAVEGFVN